LKALSIRISRKQGDIRSISMSCLFHPLTSKYGFFTNGASGGKPGTPARSPVVHLSLVARISLWARAQPASVSSGKEDEPDAETHGMFQGEQQRSNRSKKIVAR
jgi:hypothetical protein